MFAAFADSFGFRIAGDQNGLVGAGAREVLPESIEAARIEAGYPVFGVDMTDAMLEKARASAQSAGANNVEFVKSQAENLPLEDESIDVVISNGVLNLIPDKFGVLSEAFRVLRPGGKLQIADIILEQSVSSASKSVVSLWSGCIAGGLLEEELEEFVKRAGFVDFEITWSAEVFDGAPQASNAAAYGTKGITFRATKPAV